MVKIEKGAGGVRLRNLFQDIIPPEICVVSTELRGFCDASGLAYAAVAYLRFTDSTGRIQISLVA